MITVGVFGATGFQGGLTLERLRHRQADGVRPVLIGRDATRLAATAVRVGLPQAERRVVSKGSAAVGSAAIAEAMSGCDAVINCAGPFSGGLADQVIEAAVESSTHYLDTAGEQPYLKHVFEDWQDRAAEAGVTIMPAANDAAVPTDLLAAIIAQQFGPLAEVTLTHAMTGGGMSRGSLRSLLAVPELATGGGGYRYQDHEWRTDLPDSRVMITMPDRAEPMQAAAFPMIEALTIPRHVDVESVHGYIDAAVLDRLQQPIDPKIIEQLPEGPDSAARADQQFCYVLDATTRAGDRVRGVIRGRDTYGTTAAIAVQAAERLLRHPAPAGVLTAAQAFDPIAFLSDLTSVELRWEIEDRAMQS